MTEDTAIFSSLTRFGAYENWRKKDIFAEQMFPNCDYRLKQYHVGLTHKLASMHIYDVRQS